MSGGAQLRSSWILRPGVWYSLVVLGSIWRNGPEIQGTTIGALQQAATPEALIAQPSIGYLLSVLGRHYGLIPYVIIWLLVTFGLLGIFLGNLRHLDAIQRQVFVLLIAVGPWTSVVIKDFPTTDTFTFLGALVAVTARKWPIRLIGVLVFATSHPEAATITGAVLLCLILTKIKPFVSSRDLIFISAWSMAVGIPLSIWMASQGGVRSSVFWEFLPGSVTLFAATAPLAIYAWLGALWVALIFALLQKTWPATPIIAGIAVLASLSIVTADGTRVAAIMLVTIGSALSLEYVRRHPIPRRLARRSLLLLLMPAIVVSNGIVNLPYDEALTFLGIPIVYP